MSLEFDSIAPVDALEIIRDLNEIRNAVNRSQAVISTALGLKHVSLLATDDEVVAVTEFIRQYRKAHWDE